MLSKEKSFSKGAELESHYKGGFKAIGFKAILSIVLAFLGNLT